MQESRERRAELFQAGRDAYVHGSVAAGKVKPRGSLRLPDYLQSVNRDPARSRDGLRRLVQDYPGNVRKGDKELLH